MPRQSDHSPSIGAVSSMKIRVGSPVSVAMVRISWIKVVDDGGTEDGVVEHGRHVECDQALGLEVQRVGAAVEVVAVLGGVDPWLDVGAHRPAVLEDEGGELVQRLNLSARLGS